jgi:hypothetical protein
MRKPARPIDIIKIVIATAALGLFAVSCLRQTERAPVTITSSETPEPPAVRASDSSFEKFDHEVAEHKQFACDTCHHREKADKASMKIEFAGHEACIGCHLNQFIGPEKSETGAAATRPPAGKTDQTKAFCALCHTELQSNPPPVQAFPVVFREKFNMKFDHAAHSRGEAEPREGCVACHDSRGPGKSIPAGIGAHANCFTCHTPDKKIGQCSTCHELAPYSRTPQSRYVFRAVFSHADHGPGQGISCAQCHDVRNGGQGRQVTNIAAKEHNGPGNNCADCHNGSRSFGGNGPNDFANCRRCHTGPGFNMLP